MDISNMLMRRSGVNMNALAVVDILTIEIFTA